jgi:nucleotide-binding universal stress UspA family protein
MYSNIYVALDKSEHSDAASTVALDLATAFGSGVIGMHVYAARMHDYRFKQMEYTLPEEYQDEAELLRQRRIHDSLIATGLELISDSYTDVLRYR